MARFTKETAAAMGKKGKRGPSLTTLILKKTKNGSVIVDALFDIVMDKKARNTDRITAATKLLEYGFGRPVQQVDANIEGGVIFRWEGDEVLEP